MSRLTRVIRDIDVTRPSTPTGLAATPASETQLNVSWNAATDPQGAGTEAVSGIAGYRLYRNGSLRVQQAGLTFPDTALTAFTQYGYTVTAYDGAGNESVLSSQVLATTLDQTAPTAPTISASATSSSVISVALLTPSTDAGSGVSSYTLQRATDSGFTANLTTSAGLTTFPVSVGSLLTATQYFFRARAVDVAGNTGSFSSAVSATTQGAGTATNIVTLQVTSASAGVKPWTFTQWFRQGAIPAGQFITTDADSSQADARNLWPEDGSVRIAVVSALSTVVAGVAKVVNIQRTSSAPSGSNVTEPTTLDVVATLTGAGAGTYTLQSCLGIDRSTWALGNAGRIRQIPGRVMSEYHYYRPTSDAHVVIYWYVRRYSNGAVEVETLVDNGWLKVASPTLKTYGITLAINGATVYSAGTLAHSHHQRWNRVDWVSGGNTITPKHDVAYTRAAYAVPNYGYTVPSASKLNALTQTLNPSPFNLGEWSANMAGTGTQPPIAILAQHEALYWSSGAPQAYAATISNTRGSGRWPIYYRDETTGRVPLYASYTGNSLTQGWGTPVPQGTGGGNQWDIPHHPSMGFSAYLIEGRWSQLECAQFSAMNCLLETDTAKRGPGGGVMRIGSPLTTRGLGWAIRTVGQAAAITPTTLGGATPPAADLALQLAFASAIDQTTAYTKARFIDVGAPEFNTVGWIGHYDGDDEGPANEFWGREWMASFQKMSVSHISRLGIENINQTNLVAVRSHLYAGTVRKYGTESTWNFRRAAIYNMPYLGTGDAFLTTAQAFTSYKTFHGLSAISSASGSTLKNHASETDMTGGSSTDDEDGYWAIEVSALAHAVDDGYAGAQAAWNLIDAAPNFDPAAHGANDAPQFGIVPRASTALAISAATLGVGQSLKFGTIPGSVLDIDGPGFSVLQYMSSAVYDPINKQVRLAGKRSSNGAPYRYLIYREDTNTWSIVGNPVWAGGNVNQNGHGYDHNTIDPATGINYFRPYNDNTVWYWTPATGVWASLAVMNSPLAEIAGFLEWIPGTGLVYGDRRTLRLHPGASSPGSAWTTIENLGSIPNAYHAAAAYNRNSQILYWGWGNADNNARKCGPSLTGIATTNTLGDDFGSSEFGGLIAPDPVGRGFIGWKKQTLTWKHYNPDTNTVFTLTKSTGNGASPQNGTPNLSDVDVSRHAANTPIDLYGVIMYLQHNGGSGGADVWLYKHT